MTIKCFGIARDITQSDQVSIEIPNAISVSELRSIIDTKYIELGTIKSYMIAINQEYAEDHQMVNPSDEIAIIPPVSGG